MSRQADALAQSDIIPNAYRRRPANVLVAALTGRQYGWDVLTAMRNGHVIEGTWGMKPEAMLGLVRRAGHSVTGEMSNDGATVTGKRADTGDTMSVTFTVDDGVRAGLVTLKDGKPYARSKSGGKLPWEQYPAMMCYWRAVALLCRSLFSDVTAGLYTTEEIGAVVDDEGEVIEVEYQRLDPQPLSDDALAAFRRACDAEGVNPGDVLAEAFDGHTPDPLTDEHLPTMRDTFKRMVAERAAEAEIVDAEVVDDTAPHDERPATRAQVGKIKGEYARLGIEDRQVQLGTTCEIVERPIDTHNDLTFTEAHRVIEALTAREADTP